MIKESIKDLVLAIAEGDSIAIEDSFNSVMASKISDRLDDMRVSVAQGMFGSVEESVFDDARKKQADDEKRGVDPDKEYKLRMKSAQNTQRVNKALTREEVELEESTDWATHNARTATRKKASAKDLHAEFKKHANNPGHPYYKGKFSDDKDGGKTAEQKAITNIAIGTGKADKTNYLSKISHLVTPKSTNEEFTLEDYSIEELEDFIMSEDFEQLDEISKKTLGSYVNKAHDQLMKHTASVNFKSGRGDSDVLSYTHEPRTARKTANRTKGVATAIGKLTKD